MEKIFLDNRDKRNRKKTFGRNKVSFQGLCLKQHRLKLIFRRKTQTALPAAPARPSLKNKEAQLRFRGKKFGRIGLQSLPCYIKNGSYKLVRSINGKTQPRSPTDWLRKTKHITIRFAYLPRRTKSRTIRQNRLIPR